MDRCRDEEADNALQQWCATARLSALTFPVLLEDIGRGPHKQTDKRVPASRQGDRQTGSVSGTGSEEPI